MKLHGVLAAAVVMLPATQADAACLREAVRNNLEIQSVIAEDMIDFIFDDVGSQSSVVSV